MHGVTERDPREEADAAYDEGVDALERGDLFVAAEAFERADRLGTDDASYQLGIVLVDLGRYEEAASAYERAASG